MCVCVFEPKMEKKIRDSMGKTATSKIEQTKNKKKDLVTMCVCNLCLCFLYICMREAQGTLLAN